MDSYQELKRPNVLHSVVLIAGSGPIGATYARTLIDADPTINVLMVDVSDQGSRLICDHKKNSAIVQKGISQFKRGYQSYCQNRSTLRQLLWIMPPGRPRKYASALAFPLLESPSVAKLARSLSELDGEVIARDGEVVARDGEVIARDLDLISRDGEVVARDGEIIARDGKVVERDGVVVRRPA